MQNLSDNELDNLFKRAAATHGGPSYDPADWKALSKRLDNSRPPRPWIKWMIPGILSLLTITGSIIVWNHNDTNTSSEQVAAETGILENTPAPGTKDQPQGDNSARRTTPLTEKSARPKAGKTVGEEPTEATKEQGLQREPLNYQRQDNDERSKDMVHQKAFTMDDPAAPTEDDALQQSSLSSRSGDTGENSKGIVNRRALITHVPATGTTENDALQKQPLNSGHRDTDENSKGIVNREGLVTHVPQDHNVAPDNSTDIRTNPAHTDTSKTVHTTHPASESSPVGIEHSTQRRHHHMKASETSMLLDSATVPTREKPDSAYIITVDSDNPEEEAKQTRYKLAIKLAVSPDYSSVRFTTLKGSGTNYGVLAEYHVSPHWSVVAGGIWSRKIYSATGVEYNGYQVARADGDCRILDIPINVNYVFKPQRKFSFYTVLGLSTYIMNQEDYVFHVDSGYGSTSYSTNVRGKNNELFSIVNIAVGAQQNISERWTLQLEPFIKVPVKGIGEGDLSLNTLGAFFHLKYSFYNVNNP